MKGGKPVPLSHEFIDLKGLNIVGVAGLPGEIDDTVYLKALNHLFPYNTPGPISSAMVPCVPVNSDKVLTGNLKIFSNH
jgi:hypothetical protein